MADLNAIRRAQILAGEEAVIKSLEARGLIKKITNNDEMKQVEPKYDTIVGVLRLVNGVRMIVDIGKGVDEEDAVEDISVGLYQSQPGDRLVLLQLATRRDLYDALERIGIKLTTDPMRVGERFRDEVCSIESHCIAWHDRIVMSGFGDGFYKIIKIIQETIK